MTGRDDFLRVGAAALKSIDTLVASWLPNGVREGGEWCIGSRDGDAGRSMKICLVGAKAGVWSDFSAGDAGSDLISLYAYIFHLEPVDAMKAIAATVGIDVSKSSSRVKPAPAQAVRGVQSNSETAKRPRTLWVPLTPAPDSAPPPPVAHTVRGHPTDKWQYLDRDGKLLGVVYRFTRSNGDKEVLPCVYAMHATSGACEWRWMGFAEPRPLYFPAPLRGTGVVVVVEGEKCADALHKELGGKTDVVSWPGGCKSIAKADWTALSGRNVIQWPDADSQLYPKGHPGEGELKAENEQPGVMAMNKLTGILGKIGCSQKRVQIPLPGAAIDGWDVVDAIDESLDIRAILAAALPIIPDETISTPMSAGAKPMNLPFFAGTENQWQDTLIRKPSNGRLEDCRENALIIITNDPALKGVVGFNEFSSLQIKRRTPPWGGELGEWTESDDFHLGMFFAQKYSLVIKSDGAIEKAVTQAARECKYNPVTDYLRAVKWDGIERLPTWLTTAMGVKQTPYSELIGTLFLVSMVARAFRPGCQMDHAPVFEGGQGEGKSSAMRILGGEWYSETPFKVGDKDGYLAIQGTWLYEFAELDSFNRSESTAIKAFITGIVDRFRAPYGRRMHNVARVTCFCATTNQDEYFKDPTGNRRWWPILCGLINLAHLAEIRDQLFAEAVYFYDAGMRWHPTKEERIELIEPEQEKRELPDPWAGRIYRFVEGIAETGSSIPLQRLTEVTAETLLTKALNIEIGKISAARSETMRVSICMKRMGWKKERRNGSSREYYYARPPEQGGAAEKLPENSA